MTRSHCKPDFLLQNFVLIWVGHTDLSTYSSFTWSWHAHFHCGLFSLPDLDNLVWTWNNSVCSIWRWGSQVYVTSLQRTLTPLRHLILPFAFARGLYCLTLDFAFAFWIMITFDTLLASLFYISQLLTMLSLALFFLTYVVAIGYLR
jgi:hypothetical protein